MKIKSFEFNTRELAGAMGDFGTLFPFAIGFIAINGLNPTGFLVMMGLANIITGLVYRLPMPIQPMKVLGVIAIAQSWKPSMIYASGFSMGITWMILGATGLIGWLAKITSNSIIRGIQITLGILLAIEAFKMLSTWWALGIISILIVVFLRQNRYAPAAIVLMLLGFGVMLFTGKFQQVSSPSITLPIITSFSLEEVWDTMLLAGFAQIPLTFTNAVLATSALIRMYWPDKPVSERQLCFTQGLM